MLRLAFSAGLLALLCSCGSGLSFEPYEVKRPLNLEPVLGRDIVLLSARDTQALQVRYQPETGQNLITRTRAGDTDTLLLARATRYRRLYYLTESSRSGQSCYVYAMRAGGGEVTGLIGHGWQLDSLHRLVDRGEFADLVTEHPRKGDEHDARLRYAARPLHRFYRGVVEALPTYRIVPAPEFAAAVAAAEKAHPAPAAAPAKSAAPAKATAPLIRSVYPNPAHDHVSVQLSRSAPGATLELLDAQGRAVRTVRPAAAERLTLPLAGVAAGTYVLRLREDGQPAPATRRLVVE
ncbi:T9SS type A sorting domain-containing protein [Hymenobacter gummosus]|nr:T9SS type A sorting domain-containing protein [Hymenobacter gummosus]